MLSRLYSLLLVGILAVSSIAAPPKITISGPSEVEPGQLVVLTVVGEGAKSYLWIPDAALGQVLQCNPETIGLASPRIGVHKILVVASNETGEMDFSTHVLTIKKPDEPVPEPKPDPNPDDPPPNPEPPTSFQKIYDLSKAGAIKLNDGQTARDLQHNLNRILPNLVKANSVDDAKKEVSRTIENVLLLRSGQSRFVQWAEDWRKPIIAELNKLTFKSTQDYSNAVKAMIDGLSGAPLCIDCI